MIAHTLPKRQLINLTWKMPDMAWLSEVDGSKISWNQEKLCPANGGLTRNPKARPMIIPDQGLEVSLQALPPA
jgi:hypothetical protein